MIKPLIVRSMASMRPPQQGRTDKAEACPACQRFRSSDAFSSLRPFDLRHVKRLSCLLDELCVSNRLLHCRDLVGHVGNVEPLVILVAALLGRERDRAARARPLDAL